MKIPKYAAVNDFAGFNLRSVQNGVKINRCAATGVADPAQVEDEDQGETNR